MKTKIKLYFAEKYCSSPIDISDEEIEFLIEKDCECDSCGESIFELDDYPNIDIEADELLCERCYEEKYQTSCPCCEETVMNDNISNEYFVINGAGAYETGEKIGFYKVLKTPYYRNDFFGFDGMIEGAYEFIKPIGQHGAYDNDCQYSGNICSNCVKNYINNNH